MRVRKTWYSVFVVGDAGMIEAHSHPYLIQDGSYERSRVSRALDQFKTTEVMQRALTGFA